MYAHTHVRRALGRVQLPCTVTFFRQLSVAVAVVLVQQLDDHLEGLDKGTVLGEWGRCRHSARINWRSKSHSGSGAIIMAVVVGAILLAGANGALVNDGNYKVGCAVDGTWEWPTRQRGNNAGNQVSLEPPEACRHSTLLCLPGEGAAGNSARQRSQQDIRPNIAYHLS